MAIPSIKRLVLLCAAPLALGVTACGSAAVSTSSFKGEAKEVAQAVANLQSNATAGEQQKICAADLAATIVTRLGGTKGCEAAIKNQLTEVDSFEVTVESVQVAGTKATANVKSIKSGKTWLGTLTLVKEDGKWKTSSPG
jgi:copper chaperone CopZ